MKTNNYEVWAKCWSDKEENIIMKLRGTFEHITDADIFSAAYEKKCTVPKQLQLKLTKIKQPKRSNERPRDTAYAC